MSIVKYSECFITSNSLFCKVQVQRMLSMYSIDTATHTIRNMSKVPTNYRELRIQNRNKLSTHSQKPIMFSLLLSLSFCDLATGDHGNSIAQGFCPFCAFCTNMQMYWVHSFICILCVCMFSLCLSIRLNMSTDKWL